jgi:hypothetical protein
MDNQDRKTMKRIVTLLSAGVALLLMTIVPVGAHNPSEQGANAGDDLAEVLREVTASDAPDPGTDNLGLSRLSRSSEGLKAKVVVHNLEPGGVYTFWWVVPQDFEDGAPVIPGGVFVAYGASRVIGNSGTAVVGMRAHTGQAGIEGFPPLGGAEWKSLDDPLNSIVRIEIAYHGQVNDAGGDISTWRTDFWTGSACPENGSTNLAGQPHCPVYLAATHIP